MTPENSKINPEEIVIEKLSEKHNLTDFRSYEPELVSFLKEDALNNQKQKLSLTFLWFYDSKLAGYLTLLTDRINLEGDLKVFFKQKDIHYKSLPALKIGRLCVHNDFLKKGLGTIMVSYAIKTVHEISQTKAGCRFITLDAKRNPDRNLDSIHFYKKIGFKMLKQREKGTIPMYLDITVI